MRVAALYDIHGNLPALEAVLPEVEREAPDLIVVGGDVALGPMPNETLDRLIDLQGRGRVVFVRGNTDREIVDLYDGTSTLGESGAADDIWLRREAWVAQRISEAQRDFLASFPETVAFDIAGLGPTLFCHGSPRRDDEIITRVTPEARLDAMLAGTAKNIVVCGHTHVQFDRAHRGKRIVNAGSVGMHTEGRPGAYWLLIGPDVDRRRTPYDVDDAVSRIRATDYPDPDELAGRLTANDPSIADAASARFERYAAEDG
jgi:predicted phosphodiesterase